MASLLISLFIHLKFEAVMNCFWMNDKSGTDLAFWLHGAVSQNLQYSLLYTNKTACFHHLLVIFRSASHHESSTNLELAQIIFNGVCPVISTIVIFIKPFGSVFEWWYNRQHYRFPLCTLLRRSTDQPASQVFIAASANSNVRHVQWRESGMAISSMLSREPK